MRLMPAIYTIFRESHMTGMPVARPLFFADPADPALRSVDDAFLLGSDILVRCDVWEKGTGGAKAKLPGGDNKWRAFEPLTGSSPGPQVDPDLPEIFVRAGSIVPMGPVMQFDGEKPVDPLTLVVALDDSGRALGELYEDSGEGYGFEKGDFARIRFKANRTGSQVVVSAKRVEGIYPATKRHVEVVVLLADGKTETGRFE